MKKVLIILLILSAYSNLALSQIYSSKCTEANSNAVSSTSGANATTVYAGRLQAGAIYYTRRTFVEFDLSSIPSNAVILSARLNMKIASYPALPTIYTARITESWDESSVSWDDQPSYTTFEQQTASSIVSNWFISDVTTHVQKMVAGVYANYGWMLYHNNELENASKSFRFWSDDASSDVPKLEVDYYIPMSVASVNIVHESTDGLDDGSISPTLQDGPGGTYSYQWYDENGTISGANSLSLTDIPYGWYGLEVTSTVSGSVPFFYTFLVGKNCSTVDIDFNAAEIHPGFVDDAVLSNPSLSTGSITNYGNNTGILMNVRGTTNNDRSLLRFRLWLTEDLILSKADLKMISGSYRTDISVPNVSSGYIVDEDWNEMIVTYSNRPGYGLPAEILLPELTATDETRIYDVIESFRLWQNDNTLNFGWLMMLSDSVNTTYRYHNYRSSDYSDGTRRPKVEFEISVFDSECQPYSELKRKLDGGFTTVIGGQLYITLDEEYEQEGSKYLPFKLFDKNHLILESSDIDGTMLNSSFSPLPLSFDDNRWQVDLSGVPGITDEEYYILEVSNSKGDKRYLRFFYKN